jgi:cellulose 1,4-beta-cellobiosidase
MLFVTSLSAILAALPLTAAVPRPPFPHGVSAPPIPIDVNPFEGKTYYVPSSYAAKLNQTVNAFLAQNDTLNAARTRTVQKISTFVWVSSVSGLTGIDTAITEARAAMRKTRRQQIVQLVLYDLPDRDCSGGESGGEFSSAKDGLNLYKTTFVDPFASKLQAAPDLTFAVVLEPDSLGNVITNQAVPFCANASATYEEGIAYAIQKLQFPHVALYIDAAHGGWLGWDGNLPLAAAEFSKVVKKAGKNAKIRGFSTNVSNFVSRAIKRLKPSLANLS